MGRVWFSVHSQSTPLQIERHATPKNIVKMAASRAGTLLRYFKSGREEDEERKGEENAHGGDSLPTRVKKVKKDRDFKPAWKRILRGLQFSMKPKGKMLCQYCVNFPNSKNENSSFRKGSNKQFLIAKETQDKRLYFSLE